MSTEIGYRRNEWAALDRIARDARLHASELAQRVIDSIVEALQPVDRDAAEHEELHAQVLKAERELAWYVVEAARAELRAEAAATELLRARRQEDDSGEGSPGA